MRIKNIGDFQANDINYALYLTNIVNEKYNIK